MSGHASASAEAQSAVFMRSEPVPEHTKQATGPHFDHLNPNDLGALMDSMATIGSVSYTHLTLPTSDLV